MKIFKIKFNKYSYDEYDAFIVRAENEEKVVEYIKAKYPDKHHLGYIDWNSGYVVTEILLEGEAEIILGSFNAG